MPKTAFYAVKRGREPGIYSTWDECEAQTKGFSNPSFKKFNTRDEAEAFVDSGSLTAVAAAARSSPSKSTSIASTSTSGSVVTPSKIAQSIAKNEDGWNIVYTDGACHGNGREGSRAGVGVWWGSNDPRNLSERCPGDQTNNRAELIAIIRCLETDPDPTKPLLIKTDSKYSISCVRDWLPGWIARGWKAAGGQPVKNRAVIEYLAALMDNRPGKINLEHVYGHMGEIGNEGADRLAGAGAIKPELPERDWTVKRNSVVGHVSLSTNNEYDEGAYDEDFDGITAQDIEAACRLYE